VGASRNAVVKELTHLRSGGVIRTGRGFVQVLDVAALKAISTEPRR
jgi:hypothetical protein